MLYSYDYIDGDYTGPVLPLTLFRTVPLAVAFGTIGEFSLYFLTHLALHL